MCVNLTCRCLCSACSGDQARGSSDRERVSLAAAYPAPVPVIKYVAPVTECASTSPAAAYAAPVPVIGYVAPVTQYASTSPAGAPVPVTGSVAPVIVYVSLAAAYAAPDPLMEYATSVLAETLQTPGWDEWAGAQLAMAVSWESKPCHNLSCLRKTYTLQGCSRSKWTPSIPPPQWAGLCISLYPLLSRP